MFRASLLRWYDDHKRDLPWRKSSHPYGVWVSEIMLQQTRVNAVLDHYDRFLKRFPDVHSLARAKEATVLAAWSGLGYYRRARNLHAAAKVLVRERKGQWPASAEDWRSLPGIGRYTAAAIASISLGEPVAVVDGNVERVLQRVLGRNEMSAAEHWSTAADLLHRKRPGDFNQALMELGATICTPLSPRCEECPVSRWCARPELPTRSARNGQSRRVAITCALVTDQSGILLVQRGKHETVMPGMWELPHLPEVEPVSQLLFKVKHAIMDTEYAVTVVPGPITNLPEGRRCTPAQAAKLPLTGLARKILRQAGLLANPNTKKGT